MKTKVNEIPLVGPKGRKELLNRIKELEAQIAQQDYLRVPMYDVTAPQNSEKKRLRELANQGVIFNVIIEAEIESEGGEKSIEELRVISHNKLSKYIVVYSTAEESIYQISYAEQ